MLWHTHTHIYWVWIPYSSHLYFLYMRHCTPTNYACVAACNNFDSVTNLSSSCFLEILLCNLPIKIHLWCFGWTQMKSTIKRMKITFGVTNTSAESDTVAATGHIQSHQKPYRKEVNLPPSWDVCDNHLLLLRASLWRVAHHSHFHGAWVRRGLSAHTMFWRGISAACGFIQSCGCRFCCYPECRVVLGEVVTALMIQRVPDVVLRHPPRKVTPCRTFVDWKTIWKVNKETVWWSVEILKQIS